MPKPKVTRRKRSPSSRRAKPKSDDFFTSPSAIDNFFTCPRKYWWSKNYEPLMKPQSLEDGSMAHEIIKTGRVLRKASQRAREYAADLIHVRDRAGYKAIKGMKERKQRIQLAPGISMTRIIDDGGTIKKEPVLWDYKTASRRWFTVTSSETVDGIVISAELAPQSTGFQAVSYLIPPDDPAPFAAWPSRIDFLTSPGDIHTYRYDQDDHNELIIAAQIVRDASKDPEMKSYPKHRGYNCQYCPFKDPCFNAPNWQKTFKRRPVYA